MEMEQLFKEEAMLRKRVMADLQRLSDIHQRAHILARKENAERVAYNRTLDPKQPPKPLLGRFLHRHRKLIRELSGMVRKMSDIRLTIREW